MRQTKILFRNQEAGLLTHHDDGTYTFRYHDAWMVDSNKNSISLTLPKVEQTYHSKFLFPFFYNMLPEGLNKQVICKHNQIDENDHFGMLIITAKSDNIGAVSVIKIESQ